MNVGPVIFRQLLSWGDLFVLIWFVFLCASWGMGDKKKTFMFVRLVSAAGTGFFYVKKKSAKKVLEKLEFRKYDPRVNRHVLFTEAKMKWGNLLSSCFVLFFIFESLCGWLFGQFLTYLNLNKYFCFGWFFCFDRSLYFNSFLIPLKENPKFFPWWPVYHIEMNTWVAELFCGGQFDVVLMLNSQLKNWVHFVLCSFLACNTFYVLFWKLWKLKS